jgi:RNA-directed DNA polymerase
MRNTQKDNFVSTTSNITDWSSIDWNKTEKYVDKIQKRIYRAECEGE